MHNTVKNDIDFFPFLYMDMYFFLSRYSSFDCNFSALKGHWLIIVMVISQRALGHSTSNSLHPYETLPETSLLCLKIIKKKYLNKNG